MVSIILKRLVIGCLVKYIGVVRKELFTLFLCFLKICMREWRLRIKMLERNLEDLLIDMGYIKD